MATRRVSRVAGIFSAAMIGVLGLGEIAAGQVVIDMPPPPVRSPSAVGAGGAVRAGEDVGELALYRYSATRYYPMAVGPRIYQQRTFYDPYSPYYFSGWLGRRFVPPPLLFDFRRPFPIRGFRIELD